MKYLATRIRVHPVTPLIRTLRAVVLLFVLLVSAYPAAAQSGFNWAATYGKSPAQFTPADWRAVIDVRWGDGLSSTQKVLLFDRWWNAVNLNYGAFFNLDLDIFALRAQYRPEIEAGVSRGRFAAIMNHFGYRLKDLHTYLWDTPVRSTTLNKGVPLLVVGQWGTNQRFGALLTPLPDSTLLVYRVAPNHPIGLERGDLVLGYDGVPWKDLYPALMAAELPLVLNSVNGSTDASNTYYHLQAAGMNWHLFDTLDVVKYSTGDTLHFDTNLLAGQNQTLWGSEQLDVPGVKWPDRSNSDRVSWGVVEGTRVGYVYVTSWSFDAQYNIRAQFRNAIDSLMHHTETDGMILDFRFNTGGGALAVDGLSLLFNEDVPTIGFDVRAGTTDHFDMQTDPARTVSGLTIRGDPATYYDKPIAVLIGPGSISAGELEALRLSFHPRTRLFGKATAGAFTGSNFISLADNDWFASLASGPVFFVSDHSYLSHLALEPDEPVWFTRDDVARGTDTVVEAAKAWIDREMRVGVEAEQPEVHGLRVDRFPNPFSESTTLRFTLPASAHVRVEIYDVLGRRVAMLLEGLQPPGEVAVLWDGRAQDGRLVGAGPYFYRVEAGIATTAGAVVVVR